MSRHRRHLPPPAWLDHVGHAGDRVPGLRPATSTAPCWVVPASSPTCCPPCRRCSRAKCNAVLVCYGSTQRRHDPSAVKRWPPPAASLDPQPYEHPYEPVMPVSAYALAASRHMHQYGTTRRSWPRWRWPPAPGRGSTPRPSCATPCPSRTCWPRAWSADPLTVRDCCLVTDGGGAYRAGARRPARDLPSQARLRAGLGTATGTARSRHARPDRDCASSRAQRAFAMAG
jgi:hypothetical protein